MCQPPIMAESGSGDLSGRDEAGIYGTRLSRSWIFYFDGQPLCYAIIQKGKRSTWLQNMATKNKNLWNFHDNRFQLSGIFPIGARCDTEGVY